MPKKKGADNLIISGVIYARYSSHNQKEESIEQQIDECQLYAKENGITVTHIYADKAVSGRTDKRTQFQRMMRDAEKCAFDVVIAYKSNRISRNMYNALSTESKLDNYGIQVLYAKETFGNTAAGRFALRTMMNVNQFYSENMAEDIKRGMKDNAEACKVNGSLPYGYKKGEDGKYAIDEPRAAVVREIFEKYLKGVPNSEICASLNARGITTKTGGPWGKSSFHRMFFNERYIGIYEHSGIRVEGGVPAIVSKEVFYAVQERAKSKPNPMGVRRRGRADYLLTGKLLCGECKHPMIGVSGTSATGDLHYYYTCDSRHSGGECKKANVRRDFIEKLVLEMTLECLSDANIIDFLVKGYADLRKQIEEESDVPLMETELANKKKSLSNILKAIEAGIFNDTTSERMKELEYEIHELEKELELQKLYFEKAPTEDELRFYLEELGSGNIKNRDLKRDIINTFIRAIHLWNDRIEIEYNFTAGGPDNLTRSYAYKEKGQSASISANSGRGEKCSHRVTSGRPAQKFPTTLRFRLSAKTALCWEFLRFQIEPAFAGLRFGDAQQAAFSSSRERRFEPLFPCGVSL